MANLGWNADLPWGSNNWGDLSDATVAPTGLGLTSNLNSVTVDAELNVGWGRLSWGENGWGIGGDVLVTGIGLNIGIGTGTVKIDVGPEVTGEQLNLNTGTVTAFGLAEVFPTGEQLNLSTGTVDPAPDVMLTGIGLTTTTGTLEGYNEQGWGRDTWGSEVWGASGFWAFANTTGVQINASVGTVDAKPVTIASPTGIELTAEEGTVDPSPDATVVGIGLTASVAVGSVVEAEANVSVTGIGLEIAQGQAELDAITFASTTGQQLNTSVGTAVAGASAEVPLTGNTLTVGLRSINVQSWQIVDTGNSVTWNDIDTAA